MPLTDRKPTLLIMLSDGNTSVCFFWRFGDKVGYIQAPGHSIGDAHRIQPRPTETDRFPFRPLRVILTV